MKAFNHLNSSQIKNLIDCLAVCRACAKMCIEEGHQETAIACYDCADVCDLALRYAATNSPYKEPVLEVCSEICQKCAASCQKMNVDHCQECSQVCKNCSESCSLAKKRG